MTYQSTSKNYNEIKPYLFIDGSYFCFFCYYSVERWWKFAFTTEADLDVLKDPINNPFFVQKFKEKCIKMVHGFEKNLGINGNPIIYVGKDCKRDNIWRNEFYKEYKSNRGDNLMGRKFMGGPFFAIAYEIFLSIGVSGILKHDTMEADDCIALSVKYIHNKNPNAHIYVVTSDNDYLQLAINTNIHLYDLSFKDLTKKRGSTGNADCDLFCKIVMGDKSDNITSVFKKCGPKKALKYFENKALFDFHLKKENAYEKYDLNEKIISFSKIPEHLVSSFISTIQHI